MGAMDDLAGRLDAAAAALKDFTPAIAAGEPWPLTDVYGPGPESAWGPRELLAHVGEMLPFWLGEIELIVDAGVGADDAAGGAAAVAALPIPAAELMPGLGEATHGVAAEKAGCPCHCDAHTKCLRHECGDTDRAITACSSTAASRRSWGATCVLPYLRIHLLIDRCFVEGIREGDDDRIDGRPVGEEIVSHGVVGVLVVCDRLRNGCLEIW